MKKNHKKRQGLERLPAYSLRLILSSFGLLSLFMLLIFKTWHGIDKNQQRLNRYYLPGISIIFQMQNVFNEAKYAASGNSDIRGKTKPAYPQYSLLNDHKYQLKLLATKLTSLDRFHANPAFDPAFSRFRQRLDALLNHLDSHPLSSTAATENLFALIFQVQSSSEQLRRLYERQADSISRDISLQQKAQLWEAPLFMVLFFFMFKVVINLSSTAIKKAINDRERQHDEMLEKERLLFRLIFESSPNGLIIVNDEGSIIKANQEMEHLFKYSLKELHGKDIEALMPKRFREHHFQKLLQYLTHPVERPMARENKLVAIDKNGKEFPVEIGLTPLKMGEQQKLYVLATIADISKHKQAEQELRASKHEAEQANQAKSAFLARMSHELRTPLTAILGFAQLLEMEDGPAAEIKNDPFQTETQLTYAEEIIQAGEHLLSLIEELLDLSKIEAGKIRIAMQHFPLSEVLDECLALIQPLADKTGVHVDNQITGHYMIHADKLRLKQILLNLMSNAIKYNRSYGTITLKMAFQSEDRVRISIMDQGKGLTPDEQKRLFHPFERLGADATCIEGTGIGLALAKQLIELMNGDIGVDSVPNNGCTFWIEIKAREIETARQ